jgi:hypothetical protein
MPPALVAALAAKNSRLVADRAFPKTPNSPSTHKTSAKQKPSRKRLTPTSAITPAAAHNRRDIVDSMKASHLLSFALGLAVMLGITMTTKSTAAASHVYEMRTYYANPGKLADLESRFRDHTISIFNTHNMKSVGYWVPQDNKDNYLVYILEHPSKEEATKNWAAFSADPEWKKVAAASEVNGKLVNHVVSVYLDPTDFSPIK